MYRLNYASRKFWLRVKKTFKEIRLRKLDGDGALYYMIGEKGDLEGLVSTHVDDFNLAGKKSFLDKVTREIRKSLDVSTVESDCFRFIGIDVKKVKEGIEISMEDYAKSLENIQIRDAKADEPLARDELKVFKIFFREIELTGSKHNIFIGVSKETEESAIKDQREINRVLKKVEEKESRELFTKIGKKV